MRFSTYWWATTVLALIIAPIWFMAPLGLGFASWPEDPALRNLVHNVMWVSYFIGLPGLVVGQLGALYLWRSGWPKAAFWLPALTVGGLICCIMFIGVVLET